MFIEYVIEKEKEKGKDCPEDKARALIRSGQYTLSKLIRPEDRANCQYKLSMMNLAHGVDLVRCYPLFKQSEKGPAMSGNIYNTLLGAGVLTSLIEDNLPKAEQQIGSALDLINASFEGLKQTGQGTNFSMITSTEFDQKKIEVMKKISEINQRFKNPNAEEKEALLKEMRADPKLSQYAWPDVCDLKEPLEYYRKNLILHTILTSIISKPTPSTADKFKCNQSKPNNPHQLQHHDNAKRFVQLFEGLKPTRDMEASQREFEEKAQAEAQKKAQEEALEAARIAAEQQAQEQLLESYIQKAETALEAMQIGPLSEKVMNPVVENCTQLMEIAGSLHGAPDLNRLMSKRDTGANLNEFLRPLALDEGEKRLVRDVFTNSQSVFGAVKSLWFGSDQQAESLRSILEKKLQVATATLTGKPLSPHINPQQLLSAYRQRVEENIPLARTIITDLAAQLKSLNTTSITELRRLGSAPEKDGQIKYLDDKKIILEKQMALVEQLNSIEKQIRQLEDPKIVDTTALRANFLTIARSVSEGIQNTKPAVAQNAGDILVSLKDDLESKLKSVEEERVQFLEAERKALEEVAAIAQRDKELKAEIDSLLDQIGNCRIGHDPTLDAYLIAKKQEVAGQVLFLL